MRGDVCCCFITISSLSQNSFSGCSRHQIPTLQCRTLQTRPSNCLNSTQQSSSHQKRHSSRCTIPGTMSSMMMEELQNQMARYHYGTFHQKDLAVLRKSRFRFPVNITTSFQTRRYHLATDHYYHIMIDEKSQYRKC